MPRHRRAYHRRAPTAVGGGCTLIVLLLVGILALQRTGMLARRRPRDGAATVGAGGMVAAKVLSSIDGDTVVVEIEGRHYSLRYIGIDTPEMDPEPEPFALEAARFNEDLVVGSTVYLEKDVSETDRYGRLLRYVWLDGAMVNEALVSRGLAYARDYPPDVRYHDRLFDAQRAAQEAGLGMWADAQSGD